MTSFNAKIRTPLKDSSTPSWLPAELYPFQSHYFNYCGSKVHYLDEGQGLPIVFSHPAVGWSFMYRALIRDLRVDYRCIAIDYPGFGLSATPADYCFRLRSQRDALGALLDHLKLDRVILLGHDTGGASAFALAERRPELASGLILTDTIIFPVSEYPAINKFIKILDTKVFRWVNLKFNLLMQITSRLGFKTITLDPEERRVYLNSFGDKEKRNAIIDILTDLKKDEFLMRAVQTYFESQCQQTPILLMCGEKDKLVSVGIFSRIEQLTANVTTHLIPGEGHFPHEGQAGLMAKYIRAWINEHIACVLHQAAS